MKYKIGEYVRIKEYLKSRDYKYGNGRVCYLNIAMAEKGGETAEILGYQDDLYLLDILGNNYVWIEQWLEPIKKSNI